MGKEEFKTISKRKMCYRENRGKDVCNDCPDLGKCQRDDEMGSLRLLPDKEIVVKSIQHYGIDYQLNVCMEEPAELIQAISKMRRGQDNRDGLIEEMADTVIIIQTLREIYGISRTELCREVERKHQRNIERIKKAEEESNE